MSTRRVTKEVIVTFFVVEGSGSFPIDMLRYDSCCPATEADSALMGERALRRSLVLRRFSVSGTPATTRRWKSFGWRVVSEGNEAPKEREPTPTNRRPS